MRFIASDIWLNLIPILTLYLLIVVRGGSGRAALIELDSVQLTVNVVLVGLRLFGHIDGGRASVGHFHRSGKVIAIRFEVRIYIISKRSKL